MTPALASRDPRLTPLDPRTVALRLRQGEITLVDVREPDEFARERIAGAVSAPLSTLDAAPPPAAEGPVVFHSRSGARTGAASARLAVAVGGPAYVLAGGLDAWKAAGLPVEVDPKRPIELMRQVQIAAGALVLSGVGLGLLVHPGFFGLAGFVGAGLTFAGVTGWCGMARLLRQAPWNRIAA